MDLKEKIEQYRQERDACHETKDKAHKRILELNSLIKKLYFAERDLNKILEPEMKEEAK